MKEEIKKVLRESSDKPSSDILYSAVVLTKASHNKLLERFALEVPDGWKTFAHHMTIAFGKGVANKEDLGKEVILKATKIGMSDMAMAVQVEGYPSNNAIPHITIAVNPDGGKPKDSNLIKNWRPVKKFMVNGVITNIKKDN